ncbi:hypothetical protein RAH32_16375, partial [Paracoccus sp. WLY502]|uniref:hypothetical protein n=1 Tax=Paracoccus yibinensis TaxID=3068891 RepID=UPI002796C1CC
MSNIKDVFEEELIYGACEEAAMWKRIAFVEPPRVYRRVCGSMIRLLFRQRSSLRRRPPLLR